MWNLIFLKFKKFKQCSIRLKYELDSKIIYYKEALENYLKASKQIVDIEIEDLLYFQDHPH